MLNEKHNSPFHWKDKLDDLNSLPVEDVFRKEDAWEKLHSRLQQKPSKKKVIWYWAAAACILIALSTSLVMTSRKENELVKELPKQNIIVPATPLIPFKEPVAVLDPVQVEMKQKEISNNKNPETTRPNNIIEKQDTIATTAFLPVENEAAIVLNSISPVDTVSAAVTAIPLKKKMQVIHINDLVAAPAPVALPGIVKKSLKLKFGNNKAGNQTFATQQQSTNEFKINIP